MQMKKFKKIKLPPSPVDKFLGDDARWVYVVDSEWTGNAICASVMVRVSNDGELITWEVEEYRYEHLLTKEECELLEQWFCDRNIYGASIDYGGTITAYHGGLLYNYLETLDLEHEPEQKEW